MAAMSGDHQAGTAARPSAADFGPAGNFFDKYHTKNPVYRRLVRSFLGRVRSLTREFVAPAVLEVGCGEGHLARFIAQGWDAPPIVAFDISLAVIAEAVRIGGGPRFFVGSSYALPFPDKSFDLVISINSIHNLPLARLKTALREINRVCRGSSYITIDAWRDETERANLYKWVLTAETMMHVDDWKKLFAETGYKGDYWWFIAD